MRARLLLALLLGSAPLTAQHLVRAQEPVPIGYWSITTDAYNPQGRPIQVTVIVRFLPDHTFFAVLKTNDGSGEIGSGSPFKGLWDTVTVFGKTLVCKSLMDRSAVVCQYTVDGDRLLYVDRELTFHTADEVKTIAPELVSGP